ncbi:hypothetical protein NP026_23710, partial [Salmonella enterica]|nr:hypothetical protein [Salmonella enterica]
MHLFFQFIVLTGFLDCVNPGILADLGKFEKRIPKKNAEKKTVKKTVRGRGKGSVEGSAAPSSVFEAAGTYQSCSRGYTDYVVVSDTLEGLGVIGSGAAAGGTAVVPPVVGEKRGPEQKAAGGGEPKRRRLQTRRVAPAQKKPAVAAGKYIPFLCFVCTMGG